MADMVFKKCADLEGAISNSFPMPRKRKGKAEAGVIHWVSHLFYAEIFCWLSAGGDFFLNKVLTVRQTFWHPNNIDGHLTKRKENKVFLIKYTVNNDGVKKKKMV